ncbi:hypothetical protein OIU80_17515 [Flavobacterium sp. LS1R47]|uniref:DUF2946 domain-containing protein n=2 Tax=Flavobacterium frigoritolerans TaxID=2987686 RepID=A0A9X3C9I8_9FLAO|nr:hypothetical protein [Flavobacterium frigoritolerans]
MKKKFKIINLLMPLIVVFAILFPAIHSYEHIQSHDVTHKSTSHLNSAKTELITHNHSSEECAICHFKFTPVSTFTFMSFEFYKKCSITSSVSFYYKSYSSFFKGALFALRAPPTI